MNISVAALERFCMDALLKAGVDESDAKTTADVLVTTDTWGTFTHGTKALRAYIRRVRGGGLKKRGSPHIVKEGPGFALIDGDSSIAMVSSVYAMRAAMEKARASGKEGLFKSSIPPLPDARLLPFLINQKARKRKSFERFF